MMFLLKVIDIVCNVNGIYVYVRRCGARAVGGGARAAVGGGDAGADLPPRVRHQRHPARAAAARARRTDGRYVRKY